MADCERPAIVVAEDDLSILNLVCLLTAEAGFLPLPAGNGLEALELITSCRPAAVILDISMPKLDGKGVLAQMRDRCLRYPVLMLTAQNSAAEVERCLQLGARDYLTKPFEDDLLIHRLKRIMAKPKAYARIDEIKW